MMSLRGKFIVVDGGDGAGKTMQIARLKKHLKDSFKDKIVFTREPGGTPYGKKIRKLIFDPKYGGQADGKTHFALFSADSADHMKNLIIPTLQQGIHLLCDR